MVAELRRYSRWDGSQEGSVPDPDELFVQLAEDVFRGWDFESALRRLLSQGFRDSEGRRFKGLDELLEQLQELRQDRLQRYNLDGIFADITERLDRILQRERNTLEERLLASRGTPAERVAEKTIRSHQEQLERLPAGAGSAIRQLQDYQFLDQRAGAEFAELLSELRGKMVDSHFQHMGEAMQQLGAGDLESLRQMTHELNQMLERRMRGEPDGYQEFMERWGDYFPDHPDNLDSFVEQLQQRAQQLDSLMRSMSTEAREQLRQMAQATLGDPALQAELSQLGQLLSQLSPQSSSGRRVRFFGGEQLDLSGAMEVMEELQQQEALESALRAAYRGEPLSPELRRALSQELGEEAASSVDRAQGLLQRLERTGKVRRGEEGLELTARGMRQIGQKALGDIFKHLSKDRFGSHQLASAGSGLEPSDSSKPYEFGDPFRLDAHRTVMNALRHSQGAMPLRLVADDFEVVESAESVQTSTVLMLDMSRSMPLRGYFYAAKKMALALDSLIRTQYPRDTLYVVGFSDYAREISSGSLAQLSYSEYVYGTNMQHGLMLARRLLSRHPGANRQVIIVSDGEPTAHMEGNEAVFRYPPLPETFHKTLQEVRRCTSEHIVINTFMLESNQYLVQFVKQITRLNHGRAFFVSPDRLGDYVLVDYASSRVRQAG